MVYCKRNICEPRYDGGKMAPLHWGTRGAKATSREIYGVWDVWQSKLISSSMTQHAQLHPRYDVFAEATLGEVRSGSCLVSNARAETATEQTFATFHRLN
jgi:hypothetical protein